MCATYFFNYLSILGVCFLHLHCDSSNLQVGFFSSCRTGRDTRGLLTSICDSVCRVCSCYSSACTWITSRFSGIVLYHTWMEPSHCPHYSPYPVKTFCVTRREPQAEVVSAHAALLLASHRYELAGGPSPAPCVPPGGSANTAGPRQRGNAASATAFLGIQAGEHVVYGVLLTQHRCWLPSKPRGLLQ